MPTEYSAGSCFKTEAVEEDDVVVKGFNSSDVTSNAGALLLGKSIAASSWCNGFAVLHRPRGAGYVDDRVETLVGQPSSAWCWARGPQRSRRAAEGPDFAALAGKLHPAPRSDFEALPGKSTLTLFEHRRSGMGRSLTRSIATGAGRSLLVDLFLERMTMRRASSY